MRKVKINTNHRLQFLILWCFVLSSFVCTAQSFEDIGYRGELIRWNYFQIDSLWLFHPDNDTSINELSADSENWQKVNIEFLNDENGKPVDWQNIGWFRKKFDVPPGWQGKPIALRMGHFGASEIYMDGKLLIRYGIVANNIQDEKIFVTRKPYIFQLDSQSSHRIDVHYSNQHAKNPGYMPKFTGFRLFLAPTDITPQMGPIGVPTLPITVGILVLFVVFFLFVYLFDVTRLASLLTVFLFLTTCLLFVNTIFKISQEELEPIVWATRLESILSSWINCWQVLTIYALYYNSKMPRRSWIIAGIMLFYFIPAFFVSPFISKLSAIIFLLVNLELFRIIISGIIHKKPGFWILLTGVIIQQTGYFVFVMDIFQLFPIMTATQELLLMIFPQMGLPLTYALHLAWEFGTANRDLRLKLVQVNKLSETTLRQEQEKQELLTQQKEKLELMVSDRTKELSQQKEELQNTLTNLKSAQAQLIQSEKMASLGELTAGIAHEIQNPLNFVNNFSDINKELLSELKEEMGKGNIDEAKTIANDVIDNEEKINHHGKRADSIVKGMLQHSRTNTGQRELTDINTLADEYLRLSYHGLRAKDKSFNATLQTDFNQNIEKINIIPQDIGRALLNLYNNAFYTVNEKKKREGETYEPVVSVKTNEIDNKIQIIVKDNGNGIPQSIVDKIFQPFFTTKPTGQGTGLGLSLSYDIITQGHSGTLKVETKEGKGSEFIISLPLMQNV
jgi:signal transduction histidine kinase